MKMCNAFPAADYGFRNCAHVIRAYSWHLSATCNMPGSQVLNDVADDCMLKYNKGAADRSARLSLVEAAARLKKEQIATQMVSK